MSHGDRLEPLRTPTIRRNFSTQLQSYCFAGFSSSSSLHILADPSDDDDVDGFVSAYKSPPRPSSSGNRGSRAGSKSNQLQSKPCHLRSQPAGVNLGSEPIKGASSLAASTVNLTKSLVGIGLLTVPKVFADCSTLPAAITLFVFGALAALSFFMLGYCAHLTGASTLP
eukprot:TRINITY_DN35598_c0_g1_i1.p1 TRINITY_DN35598_c0_g1~~TRINITY_DN35598_c0_g1_i1.p1  ORF type:complete len:169 (-),score=10.95 TRINITY_DN35598_c0_g1_i1:225-731(-)